METQKSPGATGPIRNTGHQDANKHPRRRETKTERAYVLLISMPGGATENDILRACRLSSGRNYPNLLEKEACIELERILEPNPDGIGSHFRYRVRSARDAYRALLVVNAKRVRRGAQPLDEASMRSLLSSYQDLVRT